MKTKILLFSAILILSGCVRRAPELHIHSGLQIVGLATPILLQSDTTLIHPEDYFMDLSLIDSILINGKNVHYTAGDDVIMYVADGREPVLSVMEVWEKGYPYSILVRKSRRIMHTFTFDPKGVDYGHVSLAGSINGWNPAATPLENSNGLWQTTLALNPGTYFYQVVTDGHWRLDPANPDSADNNMGGYNSVLKIGDVQGKNRPFLYSVACNDHHITTGCHNPVTKYFVFFQNYRLGEGYIRRHHNRLDILIPVEAAAFDRSYIRIWSYNDAGESNDILIPLEQGRVIKDPSLLTRGDKESMIIYNIMVDRFYDGDTSNDHPVPDPEILPRVNYQGGDIKGITAKIDEGFFSDLGVNTIWMSPVVQNARGAWGLYPDPRTKFSGYHGYWPTSFTQVDDHFGTSADFKEMVGEAHHNGLNILLDFVAHHVHKDHPFYKTHPNWVTNLYLPDGRLNTERWDEYRLTTWFDVFLPTLDLSRPEVYNMLSDSAVYWLKTYQLDGFRHDATKHIPEIFWRTLTRKIKKEIIIPEHRPVFQIGETYGNGDLISSYVNSGELDGQFDFNVYDAAIGVLVRDHEPFGNLINTLQESFMYYGHHNLMGYITDNQDRARFISYASGAMTFAEDSKKAGWTRDIEVKDPVGYKKMAELIAFNMTIPGIPVIFYGDEIGMPGANDPDNRRMMKFTGLNDNEKELRDITKKLIALRAHNMPFLFGDFRVLEMSQTTLAYMRSYFDKAGIAVFNKGPETRTVTFEIPSPFKGQSFKALLGTPFETKNHMITITLPGHSFEVLSN